MTWASAAGAVRVLGFLRERQAGEKEERSEGGLVESHVFGVESWSGGQFQLTVGSTARDRRYTTGTAEKNPPGQ